MPPQMPSASPRRSAGTAAERMVSVSGKTIAPPIPCTPRATSSIVALVESANLPPPADWVLANSQVAINHVALTMPNREAWQKQLAFLQSKGVKFNWRVNHGVTHSVYVNDPNGYGVEFLYEMPREMWENDIDGGIKHLKSAAALNGGALAHYNLGSAYLRAGDAAAAAAHAAAAEKNCAVL